MGEGGGGRGAKTIMTQKLWGLKEIYPSDFFVFTTECPTILFNPVNKYWTPSTSCLSVFPNWSTQSMGGMHEWITRDTQGKSYITILTLVACVSIFCNLVISIIFWLNMAAFLCALSSDIYKKTKVIGYWTYITYSRNNSRFEQLSHREKWGKKTWPTEKSMLHYAKQKKHRFLQPRGSSTPDFKWRGWSKDFWGF